MEKTCVDNNPELIYFSDGFAYYEEWQHMVQKSDQEARHLLESYGRKCQEHKVL